MARTVDYLSIPADNVFTLWLFICCFGFLFMAHHWKVYLVSLTITHVKSSCHSQTADCERKERQSPPSAIPKNFLRARSASVCYATTPWKVNATSPVSYFLMFCNMSDQHELSSMLTLGHHDLMLTLSQCDVTSTLTILVLLTDNA